MTVPQDPSGEPGHPRDLLWRPLGRVRGLLPAPLWVMLLVLLLTVLAFLTVRSLVREQQTARFEREVTAYERDLRARFQGYVSVMLGVRAAWEALGNASDARTAAPPATRPPLNVQAFARLVEGLDLTTRSPGLSNIGYAPLLNAAERAAYARTLPLLAGDPAVRLHPVSTLPRSLPVTYLAPITNTSVLGYDMYSDPVRRAALDRAITRDLVSATGRLTLMNLPVNDPDRDGFILYVPLHTQGRVTGVLYAPLRLSAVLPTVAGTGENRLNIEVTLQGQRVGNGRVLPGAGFRQSEVLNLAGQDWTLDFSAAPGFGRDAATEIPWLVLLVGTVVSLLAALATQAQVFARQRAERVSRSLRLSQTRLERSRAEFESVFRAMQDTAVFTDTTGRVLFANDALNRSFGLSPFELRGSPIGDLHADPLLLDRLDALPGPHLVTTVFRRRGGGTFYGEMQRSRVVGEGGEPLGQLEVIRDVSERLAADRALREGERRYQGVLEGMPQIVFLTDAGGRVSYLNRRWQEYVGQPPEPAPADATPDWSAALLRAVHPDDRAEFTARWDEALALGRDLEVEHRLRGRDGLYRTFVTRGRPVLDSRGQVQEWVGSSTDIDDQIYAELNSRLLADVGQALNERHSDPRSDDEPAPDPFTDPGIRAALDLMTVRFADSVALWPGPELAPLIRSAQDTDIGAPDTGAPDTHHTDALHPDTLHPDATHLQAPAPAPTTVPLVRGRARRAGLQELGALDGLDGLVTSAMYRPDPTVYHSARLHPLGLSSAVLYPLVQADQPLGVLAIGFRQPLRDRDLDLGRELAQRVTSALDTRTLLARLRAARASLQDLNNSLEVRVEERTLQLSEANAELEAFSYSVSHDLRTPLRHITGFADLLRREQGENAGPKSTRYLNVITDAAGRMGQLIDNLLEFSRTSRTELRRLPLDLSAVVDAAVHDLAPDQGERAVEWRVSPLPTVVGDAALLRQVIDNLLSNALKYTRPRDVAVIEVRAEAHGREVWVSIRDNGVGFEPAYVGKLFGVFQRLHRTEEFEGTGIGLANVRRIVARHGGRVWAESGDPDRPGATFWFSLPLEPLTLEKTGRARKDSSAQEATQ